MEFWQWIFQFGPYIMTIDRPLFVAVNMVTARPKVVISPSPATAPDCSSSPSAQDITQDRCHSASPVKPCLTLTTAWAAHPSPLDSQQPLTQPAYPVRVLPCILPCCEPRAHSFQFLFQAQPFTHPRRTTAGVLDLAGQALPAEVSGARREATDTTDPMPSVAHSLFAPHRPLATAAPFSVSQAGFFRQKLEHPSRLTDTRSSSGCPSPRWPKLSQANVPGAHHGAMDPTGYGPHLLPQQPSSVLQADNFQIGTWTSQRVKQTPAPAAGVPALVGPSPPMDLTGPMPSVANSLFVPDTPPATATFFLAGGYFQVVCLRLSKALKFCSLQQGINNLPRARQGSPILPALAQRNKLPRAQQGSQILLTLARRQQLALGSARLSKFCSPWLSVNNLPRAQQGSQFAHSGKASTTCLT